MAGALGSAFFWPKVPWFGALIAFAVGHFFLFCNVFRIARALEMAWVAVFLTLSLSSAAFGRPPWLLTAAVSLCATAVVVGIEMRKPSYHGVGWSLINPGLRAWWDSAPRA